MSREDMRKLSKAGFRLIRKGFGIGYAPAVQEYNADAGTWEVLNQEFNKETERQDYIDECLKDQKTIIL
ncbi:MAG: hypothetical protein UZ04_CHB001001491 [Chlorobi bacterium OLB4]|nr:MAG: hypothetical protein UZ04_CHB001001491 [Chlorobi bacterium OLB4]MBV6399551.1 hypothetical protein [Ignavibacteria bacterium]